MNPKLQDFLSYCENKDSIVLFFKLAGELLEHLQLPDENEKVVLNVTKGTEGRRISLDLNSRLAMGFMLGREFIDLHRAELEFVNEAKFTDREPIASFLSFPFDFVKDHLELFKSEWLKCCKEYAPRNERSPYLNKNIPELLKYVHEPELILSEEVATDNDPDGKYFKNLMNSFEAYLKTLDNVLNEFSFESKTKRESIKYRWISDKDRLIGDKDTHYEIYRVGSNMFVDLHFEGEETKSGFREKIGDLPQGLKWMKWQNAKSIRTEGHVDLYDNEALKKLSDKLLSLEESIGDKVRAVIQILKQNKENTTDMKSSPLNLILYGPPGTGKTYNSINRAISIINPEFDLTQDRTKVKAEFDRLMTEGRIEFTTFHQSMSYEDFIEGIKPQPPSIENNTGIIYDIDNGIFKRIAIQAGQTNMLSYVVDGKEIEFSRKIFSELYHRFTERLPDIDENESEVKLSTASGKEFELFKNTAGSICVRAGQKKATMPFSLALLDRVLFEKVKTYHPSYTQKIIDAILNDKSIISKQVDINSHPFVLIIDEINRGNIAQIFGELITLIEEDKRLGNEESLEAILPYSKEKFGVPRNLYIIGTMNTADRSVEALDTALRRRFSFEEISPDATLIAKEIPDVDAKRIMITINKRLEKLLDKDHLIGHSYFMKVENLTDLKEVFQRNIIPLLQEYFFGDFGKIGLVLGTGFVEKIENESNRIFAKFYDYESSDLEDRPVYRIQKVSEMDDKHFTTALNTLLTNDRE